MGHPTPRQHLFFNLFAGYSEEQKILRFRPKQTVALKRDDRSGNDVSEEERLIWATLFAVNTLFQSF